MISILTSQCNNKYKWMSRIFNFNRITIIDPFLIVFRIFNNAFQKSMKYKH